MVLTQGSAVFVDTNLLIYATFPSSPFHPAARIRLTDLERQGTVLWTSRQVLREFPSATTRPGAIMPAPARSSLEQVVQQFEAEFQVANEDSSVTARLLKLVQAKTIQGKQIHDANIVATMEHFGISWLLTHNTSDFVRYSQIKLLPLLP